MASRVESSSRSRARPVIPWAAAPLMKASATGPRAQKVFSAVRLGPDQAAWHRSRPSVVVVVDGGLTRGNDQMLGDDLAQEHHLDHSVSDAQADLSADVVVRHRVAGRAEPDAAQLVHLAGDDLADLGPQGGQVAEQLPLGFQPLGGDGTDLRVDDSVHLVAPEPGLRVGTGQIGDRQLLRGS